MKKFIAALTLAALAIPTFAFAEATKIAVLYSDTVDDKGWCQSMDTGMKNAIAKGYDIEYTPVESIAIADAPNTLEQLAGNYDLIIVHGAQFSSAVKDIAAEYPDQVFAVGTSKDIFGDNVFSYMPQSEEPGYVNGIIAGKLTKANKVGIVGPSDGGDSYRYVRGFIKGLQDTNPDADYMLSWTGSFSDTVGAGDIAKTFVEAGCDILVGPAQQAVGAIRIVDSTEGVLWIGQTTSQLTDFPNVVVGAADYDYSAVITTIIDKMAAGTIGGELIPLCYNNGGFIYTFSENEALLPADVKAAAQAALDTMAATPDTIDFESVTPKQ